MTSKRDKKTIAIAAQAAAKPAPQDKAIHRPVSVSFTFVQPGKDFCLSKCSQDEVRHYKDCLRKLTTMSWQDVLNTGGKPHGGKTGLGYTPYNDRELRGVSRPPNLDEGVAIAGVRSGSGARLFGAHHEQVFYVLWFDPNHKIVKG